MSTQTKPASNKQKTGNKDYIAQITKSDATKDIKGNQVEDLDWEDQHDDDEPEQVSNKKGVIVEQGKIGTDKPKKLRDLFADEPKPKVASKGDK